MPNLDSLFQSEEDSLQLPFTQSHAFLIGIDAYEHISPLRTAVKDASDIAGLLSDVDKHAYQVHLYKDATKAKMEECFAKMQTVVQAEDRVLFYFAGHGIALDSEKDPEGYLVPADAKSDDKETLVKMDRLHEVLLTLPCKHGLLVLDCCFAGSFKWSTGSRSEIFDFGQTLYAERFWRYVEHPAWQVITSSAHDQKASDLLDHQALGLREEEMTDTQNSPFAWAFKQAIDLHSKADTSGRSRSDGIVTVTELFLYLQEVVLTASQNGKRQSPALFSLESKHDTKGEYIFINPGHKLNLPKAPSQNPYKGLVPYENNELDTKTFFGREMAIGEMQTRLTKTSILIVSAPSGQGKSSTVKAGLLPKLKSTLVAEPIILRPSDGGLPAWKKLKDLAPSQSALVVIDQYEELFSLELATKDLMEDALLDLVDRIQAFSEGGEAKFSPLKLIITIRADFDWQLESSIVGQGTSTTPMEGGIELAIEEDEPQAKQGFWKSEAIRHFLYRLPPMSRDELREMMLKPAWVVAYDFESNELVEQILDEIHNAPGALPLLSFTLNKLFEHRDTQGRLLTQDAYNNQLKGVNGALSTYADEVFESLSASEQDFMRKLMLRMIQLNDGSYSRRKVYIKIPSHKPDQWLNELNYPDHLDSTKDAVIAKLQKALLLIEDPEGNYLEPMHDSLINFWPRCLHWIQEFGRENLLLQRQLWQAVVEWKTPANVEDDKLVNIIEGASKQKALWDTHPKLSQVIQSVIENVKPELLKNDKSALWIELMAMTNELAAEDRELVKQHLFQWRDQHEVPQLEAFIFSGASIPLFDILLSKNSHWINQEEAAFVKQSWEAKIAAIIELKRERDEARALVLSIRGKYQIKENPILGLKLLKKAYQKVPINPPAQLTQNIVDTFYNQLRQIPLKRFSLRTSLPIKYTLIDKHFNHVFAFLADDTVQTWGRNGQNTTIWPNKVPCQEAKILPIAKGILVLSPEYELKLYSKEGALIIDYSQKFGKVASFQFTENATLLLLLAPDKKARIWNLKEEQWEEFEEKEVALAVISPKGKSIFISFGNSSYIRQFSEESPKYLRGDREESQGEGINAAVFSEDGKWLLTADQNGRGIIWSLKGIPNLDAKGEETPLREVQFGPEDNYYLAISETSPQNNNAVYVWNNKNERIARISPAANILSASFFYTITYKPCILTLTSDGSMQFWDLAGEAIGVGTTKDEIRSLYLHAYGNRLFTQNGDKEISAWKLSLFATEDRIRRKQLDLKKPLINPTETHQLHISEDDTVFLTVLERKEEIKIPQPEEITSMQFSPDGRFFILQTRKYQKPIVISVWNLKGEHVPKLSELIGDSSYASFAPSQNYLLTLSQDKRSIRFWDYDGKQLGLINNAKQLETPSFSTDSNYILTQQKGENPAKLWNRDGKLIASIGKNIGVIFFTEDGESIYFEDDAPDSTDMNLLPSPNRIFRLLLDELEIADWTAEEVNQYGP